MDNLVEQYKEKINDLMNTNQTLLVKIEQLENELKLKQVKNENSEKEEKEKEQYLSKINLLERQLQNLRENFEKNKNKEYKLLLNSCLETFKKIKKMPKIKNNNNLEEFLISKLKDFFKEISIKNDEIQLNEK